jgi:centromeric protein E
MRDYNPAIFAYAQIVSGKTFTLLDQKKNLGLCIPRAMKGKGEHLLQCGYSELYNETIFALLAPLNLGGGNQVWIQGVKTNEIVLSPLREEAVTSLKGVKDVPKRGEGHRRTPSTGWNERSSRKRVFRLVIESREHDPECQMKRMEVCRLHPSSRRRTSGG